MKHGHLTEQRKHFVEAYCRLGNGTLAIKENNYEVDPHQSVRDRFWHIYCLERFLESELQGLKSLENDL